MALSATGCERGRSSEQGLTVSPKWRAIFLKGMLNRDSDLWPDLVLFVGEVVGDSWVAAADAASGVEQLVGLELELELEPALGGLGSRGGCWR